MILIIIASILNVLLILLSAYVLRDASIGGLPELLLLIFIFVTPVVNLIALWMMRSKGKKEMVSLQDLKERLEKIEAALQKEPPKP